MLSHPSWYLTAIPGIQAIKNKLLQASALDQTECKQTLYDFFELHLSEGDFALGCGWGENDGQRMPIDTVIIHHTALPPGLSAARLSAIQLTRLYAPYFADRPEVFKHLKGQPIFSGHERKGKQVFWPYHWLIRNDGKVERLLSDSEIGWHAGNWNINCRSVTITFDNDFENSAPSGTVLQAAVALILNQYGQVPITRIFGHREINVKTTCPSNLFLSSAGVKGWKSELINAIAGCRNVGGNASAN